jgi:hypothetical protein
VALDKAGYRGLAKKIANNHRVTQASSADTGSSSTTFIPTATGTTSIPSTSSTTIPGLAPTNIAYDYLSNISSNSSSETTSMNQPPTAGSAGYSSAPQQVNEMQHNLQYPIMESQQESTMSATSTTGHGGGVPSSHGTQGYSISEMAMTTGSYRYDISVRTDVGEPHYEHQNLVLPGNRY